MTRTGQQRRRDSLPAQSATRFSFSFSLPTKKLVIPIHIQFNVQKKNWTALLVSVLSKRFSRPVDFAPLAKPATKAIR
jgi:hypothetical protein